MKKILIPASCLLISGMSYGQASPSTTENYVYSKTYLSDPSASSPRTSETVQYFDGLGRPKQVVNVKASPSGKDLVTPIPYDGFGRQADSFLPAPMASQNGGIQSGVEASAQGYHNDSFPFTHKNLENSPLDRVLSQVQPGSDWQNHPVSFQYDANAAGEVRKYTTVTTTVEGRTESLLKVSDDGNSSGGFYKESQLYKNTVTDEDGNKTIEFKNGQGQLVLVRKVLSDTETADTYYIYNEYSQLAFVIPPKAAEAFKALGAGSSIGSSDTTLTELCYQYRYDGRNRLVEKKVPGKGWEYLCYDQADRLILTQDAELRKKERWLITKYDALGRVAYTGILAGGSRADMQSQTGSTIIKETRNDGNYFIRNGMQIYYTNSLFYQIETVLSVNYYDTYPQDSPALPSQVMGQNVLQPAAGNTVSTKSLPLASYIKNIEDDNWTKSYTGYDMKGRPVMTHSVNYLGGYTHTESLLDFSGVPKQTVTRHKRLSTDTERIITETFEYDNQNRLLVHRHKVNNNTEEILAQNTYNELSQLTNKKVGGISASNPLQSIDYQYNIRGWMTKVNDPDNLGSDLFGYKINYNIVEGLETPNTDFPDLKVKPRYNGNIAEVSWKTLTEQNEPLKKYGYAYDQLNRLRAGFYQKSGTSDAAREYFEKLDYDLNGNITRLKRSAGLSGSATTAMLIDDLKYDYSGNKLLKIKDDQVGNNLGYPYLSTPNTIDYDANGNMVTHKDKGIATINYNILNLPVNIEVNPGLRSRRITQYIYRADGVKIGKSFYQNGVTNYMMYLDSFQYKYNDNNIAGSELQFVPTSEGYYSFADNSYIYNYTDHLGNVRLSYTDTNKDGIIQPRQYYVEQCDGPYDPSNPPNCISYWKPGEIVESNTYYPFGLLHNYTATTQNAYQYKYQGQELQETGWYSFKWRNYMPDVGRFFNVDPLATKYPYNSTYAFQENKLGMGVELEGLELLKNHTGFFVIRGNEMQVKRAPISQIDSNGYATFTPASIGLTTKGYNPGAARVSDGSVGLKLSSYKYNGPITEAAQMEGVKDMPENSDNQKFSTTKRGLEMTSKLIKNYNKLNNVASGAQELYKLGDLAASIPDAIKSMDNYIQASKDVLATETQAKTMDQAIKYVDSS
uniref:DUF6443 domain-containing protein n=1 Tax=uncultured Chryseobacterium sp. TaxID=259322 RepID=UPI0025F8E10E